MIGTHRNMPMMPQILPHRIRDMMMTSELRLSDRPIMRGSMKLLITVGIAISTAITVTINGTLVNCTIIRMAGKATPRIAPMVGI